MKQGDHVKLQMQKALCMDTSKDNCAYSGEVLRYDAANECLYFALVSSDLAALSLDAIYECEVWSDTGGVSCTGIIRERYCGKCGKTVKFEIKNGFYKINVK